MNVFTTKGTRLPPKHPTRLQMRQESREMNLQSLDLLTMKLTSILGEQEHEGGRANGKGGAPKRLPPSTIYMHLVILTKMPLLLHTH